MSFKKLNNIFGWFTFLLAVLVYFLTMEPTASWWDCGEFISAAFKLEVGHPPGAPFFMLIGRIFTLFAPGTEYVALMINALSALASAFTILFLFWTVTHFAYKIVKKDSDIELTNIQKFLVLASGFVGAMAYTFTESFWFSAVEGEVYALSSFFTAIVFWAILKWEQNESKNGSDRWIVFIAYLMGLSIGVHLLNLLTIPAIAYVIYYKKYKSTRKGFLLTGLIGFGTLIFVQYGIIPMIVKFAAKFDFLFVNGFGLPFWSGAIFFFLLLIAGIIFGIRYTIKNNKTILNTALLCFAFILFGYSTYTTVVLRSLANPPMDENNPEDMFSLLSYLNREQYGDRPLFFGHQFTGKIIDQEDGDIIYYKGKDKYEKGGNKIENIWDEDHLTVLPRMYSTQGNHIREYKRWSGHKGSKRPTMGENLKFFFVYQLNHMYFRYFLWNFAGRQNDVQGHGEMANGNWVSGIPFLDEGRAGKNKSKFLIEYEKNNCIADISIIKEKYSDNPELENLIQERNDLSQNRIKAIINHEEKGQSYFYLLPLILGIIGILYQVNKDQKDSFLVFLLFLMTGIAIVFYLNQYPLQPRERDYAYAGSFYAFAIWIGLSVLAFFDFLNKKLPKSASLILATGLGVFAGPYILGANGWYNHDRSNKYTARDFAANYLESCPPNAILFTNGDNDTFPLWYAQEVEGIRTDVRVVNLALLAGDWYITQVRRKAYESEGVPSSIPMEGYEPGVNDFVPFYKAVDRFVSLGEIVKFIGDDDPATKVPTQRSGNVNYVPTRKLYLPVDSAFVVNSGLVSEKYKNQIVKNIQWEVSEKKPYLGKHELIVWDIIATANWKRPICFVAPQSVDDYINIEPYCQQLGMVYQLVPVRAPYNDGGMGFVNSLEMYKNIMTKFKWGNMELEGVYLDPETYRMSKIYRTTISRLANALIRDNEKEKAKEVLDLAETIMPMWKIPYDQYMLSIVDSYYKLGENKLANNIIREIAIRYEAEIRYYFSLDREDLNNNSESLQEAVYIFQRALSYAAYNKQNELIEELNDKYEYVSSVAEMFK